MHNSFNTIIINDKRYPFTSIGPGRMYFLFSNNPITPAFLYVLFERSQMINVATKRSIRLHNYDFRLKNIYKDLEMMEKLFNVKFEVVNGYIYDMYQKVLFLVLKNIMKNDIIIIGTSGISAITINKLIDFFLHFLKENEEKSIVFFQTDYIGKRYPDFELMDVSLSEPQRALTIFESIGIDTGERVSLHTSSQSSDFTKKDSMIFFRAISRHFLNTRVKINIFLEKHFGNCSFSFSEQIKEYDRIVLKKNVSSDLHSGTEGVIIEFKDRSKEKFLSEILDYKNKVLVVTELDQNQVSIARK